MNLFNKWKKKSFVYLVAVWEEDKRQRWEWGGCSTMQDSQGNASLQVWVSLGTKWTPIEAENFKIWKQRETWNWLSWLHNHCWMCSNLAQIQVLSWVLLFFYELASQKYHFSQQRVAECQRSCPERTVKDRWADSSAIRTTKLLYFQRWRCVQGQFEWAVPISPIYTHRHTLTKQCTTPSVCPQWVTGYQHQGANQRSRCTGATHLIASWICNCRKTPKWLLHRENAKPWDENAAEKKTKLFFFSPMFTAGAWKLKPV